MTRPIQRIVFQAAILVFLVLTSACASAAPSATSEPVSTPSPLPTTTLATAWAGQGYSGHLVLIASQQTGNQVTEIDLASGASSILFQAPPNSWLVAAAVSPDDQQILLTYAPPPADGSAQLGYSDLYLMPIAGGAPQPFLVHKAPQEVYFDPDWSPDGKSIYYTHLYPLNTNSKTITYQNDIERASLDGKTATLIPHALWPVLSPDGMKMAYLDENPTTFSNDLYQANADGSQFKPVLPPGTEPPVDAHLYSKDGQSLIFSMVNPQTAPASSWFDRLLGVDIASAHSVPSDWYRVPLTGGDPVRLTNLNDIGMNASLSPDGSQMAFIGSSGLYIMNLDGSNLFKLSNQLFVGTVSWIP